MILSNIMPYVLADVRAGNSVELVSSSGRGKTDFTWQLYLALCRKYPDKIIGFNTAFLATYTPPDLIGYQFKGTSIFAGQEYTRSEASLPLWMQTMWVRYPGQEPKRECIPAWGVDIMVLVLDEYGQGEADTKRCAAQLFLKKEIGPWRLPSSSMVIACSNKGARYGVTKDFDFVINRKGVYHITDDLESWLNWANLPYEHDGQQWHVSALVKAFAAANQQILFEDEPKEQGPWCTPRSLCSADRFMQMVEEDLGRLDPNDSGLAAGVSGKIGAPAGGALMGWLTFRLQLPQYDEVINDPAGTPVPQKPDLQMLMAYEMAGKSKKQDLPAIVAYMQRFPKDLAVTYIVALCRREKMMVMEPAIAAWTNKNATLLALVQSL